MRFLARSGVVGVRNPASFFVLSFAGYVVTSLKPGFWAGLTRKSHPSIPSFRKLSKLGGRGDEEILVCPVEGSLHRGDRASHWPKQWRLRRPKIFLGPWKQLSSWKKTPRVCLFWEHFSFSNKVFLGYPVFLTHRQLVKPWNCSKLLVCRWFSDEGSSHFPKFMLAFRVQQFHVLESRAFAYTRNLQGQDTPTVHV